MVDWDTADRFIKWLSGAVRAALGMKVDEDVFQGLIHTNDDRERTKLSSRNVYRHTYLNVLADVGGEEWEICRKIAEEERHLFIAEEGQRATDFISSLAKKKEEVPVTNITMQTQAPPEKQEKKGLFRR